MRRCPSETKTATSLGEAILANPDAPAYETAWERMMQDMREKSGQDPPLDHLGRTPRERKGRYGLTVDNLLGTTSNTETEMPVPRTPANESSNNETKVLMIRDHGLEFPEMYLKVYVMGPPEDTKGFARLFARAACEKADDIHDADLAVFTGGPDVDPAYYGEDPHSSYCGSDERDYEDIAAYLECLKEGIPMFGVCRGAQFIAVMAGYKLAQDLNNHTGDHPMYCEKEKFLLERVSSVHHQAVIPGPGMEVLGKSFKSSYRWLNPKVQQFRNNPGNGYNWDLEAYFIRDICALGVQGHPEYGGYHSFAQWTLKQISDFIACSPDIDIIKNKCRLKPEFIAERDAKQKLKKTNKETLIPIPSETNLPIGEK